MDINLIFYNDGADKDFFELENGKRPWDIILLLSKGSFSLEFPKFGESYTINENEISFVPANTEFIRKIQKPINFFQFAFRYSDSDIPYALSKGKLNIPTAQTSAIIQSLKKASSLCNLDVTRHILERIIVESYLFSCETGTERSGLSLEVRRAIEYMNAHLGEKIDMDELAKSVFLSHTGLIWKFRKELDTTPSSYLISLRLRKAKQMLLEKNIPISEIALACGYDNAYYFSNAFRAYSGMSPTAFKKSYLKDQDLP